MVSLASQEGAVMPMTSEQQDNRQKELALVPRWTDALREVEQRIGGRYARSEARAQALRYLLEAGPDSWHGRPFSPRHYLVGKLRPSVI